MIYKVVPAAMVITGTKYDVSKYFQEIINQHAKDGWRFYSMETATAEESPGCALLNLAPTRTSLNLLVFCKEETGNTVSGSSHAALQPSHATSQSAQPKSIATHSPTQTNQTWTCSQCGTSNKLEYGMCKKCGTYRGAR